MFHVKRPGASWQGNCGRIKRGDKRLGRHGRNLAEEAGQVLPVQIGTGFVQQEHDGLAPGL